MFRVLVVGAMRDQVARLRNLLAQDVSVRCVSPKRALRLRGTATDLMICTRFLGHKHTIHIREVIGSPVIFCPGGIGAWRAAILDAQRSRRQSEYQRAC